MHDIGCGISRNGESRLRAPLLAQLRSTILVADVSPKGSERA